MYTILVHTPRLSGVEGEAPAGSLAALQGTASSPPLTVYPDNKLKTQRKFSGCKQCTPFTCLHYVSLTHSAPQTSQREVTITKGRGGQAATPRTGQPQESPITGWRGSVACTGLLYTKES